MKGRFAAAAALSAVAAAVAGAQVGYPPARSPYLDLYYTQEITPIVGYYVGRGDAALADLGARAAAHVALPSAGGEREWTGEKRDGERTCPSLSGHVAFD